MSGESTGGASAGFVGFALAALVAAGVMAHAQDDLPTVLQRVSDRVQRYYGRAQSIVCIERVMVQPMRHDMTTDGFAKVLEFELRIDWDAMSESDRPLEARVLRELRKVNGRTPRPNYEPGCLDPKSGALEPLAFLLPQSRRLRLRVERRPPPEGSTDDDAGIPVAHDRRDRRQMEGRLRQHRRAGTYQRADLD